MTRRLRAAAAGAACAPGLLGLLWAWLWRGVGRHACPLCGEAVGTQLPQHLHYAHADAELQQYAEGMVR